MTSLPANPTLEDIEDELAFNDVQIVSLDPHADDYEARLAELQSTKTYLEGLLENYEDGIQLPPTSGEVDGGNDAVLTIHPRARDNFNTTFSFSTLSGTKRPLPISSELSSERASKRPTPEPPASNASGPSGESVAELRSKLSETRKKREEAALAEMRKRQEAQQADAALARELSSNHMEPPTFASSSRSNLQATINPGGGYRRPPSEVKPPSTPSAPLRKPQSLVIRSPEQRKYFKPEFNLPRETNPSSSSQNSMDVVDLTGSGSDSEGVREIHPNYFSSIHPAPRPSMGYTPTSLSQMRTTASMPGAFPGSRAFASPAGPSNGLSSGPANRSTSQYPYLDIIRSVASRFSGDLDGLGYLISGSNSVPHRNYGNSDDEDEDLIYTGSRRMGAFGAYTGNEALYRSRYDAFAAYNPTQSKEEIQALLQNIRPDEDMPSHLRVKTPEAMQIELHKYQELGLTWLQKCEEGSNKGGILADDMGLGKTIQMLALIITRKSEDWRCKTTLVVAPVALMRQWKEEIEKKLKPGRHQITCFIHHGPGKKKKFSDLAVFDVVLTTYGSIASDLKRKENLRVRQIADPNARETAKDNCVLLGSDSKWYRVILDEAQCIKNRSTQSAKGACMLNAKFRWCMSGTPMMNNVDELFSLVHFLRIKPYCTWEKFKLDFSTPLKSGCEETRAKSMRMLQTLCKAIMLRRTKKSTFEGQPILVLPERTTEVDNPELDDHEREFYHSLENQTQLQFNKYLRRGTVGSSYSQILVLLLRLRQACCHPHLIKNFGTTATSDMSTDQMVEHAKKLSELVVNRIKEGGGNFECPVCYDATSNPAIFIPCGHDSCSECLVKLTDPALAIRNGEEGGTGFKCPNCRGPIDPKNITDFTSFKKVHMPELLTSSELQIFESNDDEADDDTEDSETESDDDETESEDEGDNTLGGFIVRDGDVDSETESESGDDQSRVKSETNGDDDQPRVKAEVAGEEDDVIPPSTTAVSETKPLKKAKAKSKKKSKGKTKKKEKKPKTTLTLADLKKNATKSSTGKRAYLRRLRKTWVSSAKIDKTMAILKEITENDNQEKVLIFSQWTSLLDLLEIPIDDAGYGYRRYDGSMNAKMRADAVDDFKDDRKNVRLMLVSLKAGNAGLNLNMASQVIILDPFWNPYIEEQAIDRAHRIGQTRPVKVHRVLIEQTVEDRIIELQEKKRALISEALDEKASQSISRLGVQELAYLFGVTANPADRIDYTPRDRR